MKVEVRSIPLDPWSELRRFEEGLDGRARAGACATFVGSVRDFNEETGVEALFLEHYPGMTERHLENIAREASENWQLIDALIVHRVGTLRVTDPIVLVAVWSGHRREAFEACRAIMEELKARAPFWKKELLGTESRWVQHNRPG